MNICYLTITPDAFHRETSHGDFATKEDLWELISSPTITEKKNGTVYIMPYKFSSEVALKENCESQTALFLDIDGTATIPDVIADLERLGLIYFLYTTFSHTAEKHKFRVIVPYSKPVPKEIFDDAKYKEELMAMFPYNDRATLKVQGFFAPNIATIGNYSSTFDGYIFRYRDGKFLDSEAIMKRSRGFQMLRKIIYDHQMSIIKHGGNYNMESNDHVVYFLNTPFPTKGGDLPSFKAICACVAGGDDRTLHKVLAKMRLENWNERQIQHKIDDARKGLL